MKIQESRENYLETILILENKNGVVRSIDIANELGFSKASISRAMGSLKNAKLVTMDKNNQILFTELGREKATEVYERHCLITGFLQNVLGIEESIANEDACHMEHVISNQTFDALKKYMTNINNQ